MPSPDSPPRPGQPSRGDLLKGQIDDGDEFFLVGFLLDFGTIHLWDFGDFGG